jgi:D-methionine transport system substrate-binding protein
MKAKFWRITIPALLLGFLVLLPAFAGGGRDRARDPNVVRVGIVGEHNQQWEHLVTMLAREGITIQLIRFGDYIMPNQALADGDIDLNAFQHYAFLNNQIRERGFRLSPIGDTIIAPLGLYSRRYNSISEFRQGDRIAIPSDPTNGGRSLKLLETAGLIRVDPGVGYMPVVADITENRLGLQFFHIEAANTARMLPDVAAAIINGSHAVDNGLNPSRDAIFLERQTAGSDNPFINVIAARTEDINNPVFRRIVEAYQSDEIRELIERVFEGVYLPAF